MAIIDWLNDNKNNISFKLNDKGFVEFSFTNPPKPIFDKDTLIELINIDAHIIKYGSPILKDDIDVARAALNKNSNSLKYLSDDLRNNIDIVREALNKSSFISKSYDLIMSSGEKIKQNKDFILELLNNPKMNGKFFRFVATHYKDDRELNLLAVKKGLPLRYIDKSYSLDREFVIEFVKQKAENIKVIHEKFRHDEEIAIISLNSTNGGSYKFFNQALATKQNIIVAALRQNRNNFFTIPYAYRKNIEGIEPQEFINSLLLADDLENGLAQKDDVVTARKPKI